MKVKNRVKMWCVVMGVLLAMATGCSGMESPVPAPQLTFEAPMNVGSDEELHISLGVRNAGSQRFEGDEQFDGRMELRRAAGELRASAEAVALPALEVGEMAWPINWEGRLEPGPYRLIWGADSYGFTTVDFTIVERDGRLYLMDDAPETPTSPEPTAEAGEVVGPIDDLVAQAIADLKARLGVESDAVTVQQVEAVEFPDASLGVPEPGQMYAQVITPGYVIRLEAVGQVYVYHAAEGRVVLASPAAEERASGDPSYQPVFVPELGLTFDAPADWPQLEGEMAWMPEVGEAGDELRLAFNWMELEPPVELEAAMLPQRAQIIDSSPVDLGWTGGRRFTLEAYAPEGGNGDAQSPVESFQTHTLVTLEQGEKRLGLDFYAVAPSAEALQEVEPLLQRMLDTARLTEESLPPASSPPSSSSEEASEVADWSVFQDKVYGFQVKYPPDWTYQEMSSKGPGVPDDWPLERMVIFFPQAWAERFEQSGPPDPNAPPAIPAISLEVYVGSEAQYRRVYVEPDVSERVDIGGTPALREEEVLNEQMRLIRYVFQSPVDEQVRVVLADNYSAFIDRALGNEVVVTRIQQVIGTFEFVE